MSETALELWNNIEFLDKRTDEQHEYIVGVIEKQKRGEIGEERSRELIECADFIYKKFRQRIKELRSIKK